jgi:uncharacterized protein (UPF0218 family)
MEDILYTLPKNLRDVLSEPIGRLVSGNDVIPVLLKEENIVSIGDQVTYTLIANNHNPIFCIVDYHVQRKKFPKDFVKVIQSYGDYTTRIVNPKGTITKALWDAIENALKIFPKKTTRIEIIGEEDLASLAVIYLAPTDVTIIYGLPNKGVLIVKPTYEIKKKVKSVLDMM